MALSPLTCLWDDPDTCPQVRVDGLLGIRYCRWCGADERSAEEEPQAEEPTSS